jgi:hypothetical protein
MRASLYLGGETVAEQLTEKQARIQIEKWKEIYQNVYAVEIGETFYVFRALSRSEYRKAMEMYEDEFDRAEYVCSVCVLDPAGIDYTSDLGAGIPETITTEILTQSGFIDGQSIVKELMFKYDNEMNSFDNQLTCVIGKAFPQYRLEEIETWGIDKTMWFYSRAKWVLKTFDGIELEEER